MLVLFLLLFTLLVILLWVRQENIVDMYKKQTVSVENWALPSQVHGGVFNPDLVASIFSSPIREQHSSTDLPTTTVEYTNESTLDSKVEGFFAELIATTNEAENEPVAKQEVERISVETVLMDDLNEQPDNSIPMDMDGFYYQVRGQFDEAAHDTNYQPINLLVNDMNFESNEVHIDPSLKELADCCIADERLGFQGWVAKIIGIEQEYLHISDGTTRVWINAELFNNKRLQKGDICLIEVERLEDQINVKSISVLQRSYEEPRVYPYSEQNYNDFEVETYVS